MEAGFDEIIVPLNLAHLGRWVDVSPQHAHQCVAAFLTYGQTPCCRLTWITGPDYATDAWQVDPIFDHNLTASVHHYHDFASTASLDPLYEQLAIMIQLKVFPVPSFYKKQ